MKNIYDYYIKIIKPIEKKYTRMCILYSFTGFSYYKKKMVFYNKILINYYKIIKKNDKYIQELEKYFN